MLTKTDYEDLNMLINITKSMYHNFQKLCDMEMAGQKDSKELLTLIEEIKRDVLIKNNCFDRITDTPEKCIEVDEYLKKVMFRNSRYSGIPTTAFVLAINKVEDDDVILGHILNQISKKILDNTDYMVSIHAKMLSSGNNATEDMQNSYAFQYTLQSFLMMDMYNLVLSLNERRINAQDDEIMMESSIKTKYQLIFLILGLSTELLNHDLDIPLNPFLINNTANIMNKDSSEMASFIKSTFLVNQAARCFNEIISYSDEQLMDLKAMAYILNVQDTFRAVLILSDNKTEEKIVAEIKKYLTAMKAINGYHNNIIGQGVLKKILVMKEEDKTIPQIVSFGRI